MTDHPVRVRTSTGWQDLALVGPAGPTGPAGADLTVPGPQGPAGPSGGTFPDAPSDGTAYNRKNAAWVADAGGGSAASVTFAPAGNVAATNVQAAIAEVDTEKVAKAGDTMTGALTLAPLTGVVTFQLSPVEAAKQANINFLQSGVGKWQVGKKSNDDFNIYDVVSNGPLLTAPSNGTTVTFGKAVLLAADPTVALGAATKQYVDNKPATDNTKVLKTGDVMTGGLALQPPSGSAQIQLDPIAGQAGYFNFSSAGGGAKWLLGKQTNDTFFIQDSVAGSNLFTASTGAGGTFNFPLTLSGDPTSNLHAATKQYVDNKPVTDNTKVLKAGDTMTGALSIAPATGNALFNINPTQAGSPALVYFKQTGSSKWVIGKAIDQSFLIQDDALGQSILTAVSGGGVTIGRPMTLSFAPTADMHAATKKYVDDKPSAPDTTKVLKAGDTMSGGLNIATTTGASHLSLNPTEAAQQAAINFSQTNVGKWQLGKQTDDSFFFYDNVAANYVFTVPSGGSAMTIHKDVTMVGPTTHRGNCRWRFDGPAGSGSYYDTATVADRFFLGSDSGGDTFRLFSAGTSTNVFGINGATGNIALTSTTSSTSTTTGALVVTGGLGVAGNVMANAVYSAGIYVLQEVWGGACSDEVTPITTGVNKLTFSIPYNFALQGVYASLNTASSSGVPTIDINEAGVSVLSTRITIDVNEKTGGSAGYQGTAAAAAVMSDIYLAAFAEIGIDIDVAGTGAKGLKVFLIGYRY